jgi:hypothetical protein
MSDRKTFRLASTSTRMLAGTLVSTAAVIAVVTAVSLPWPSIQHDPVSVDARPAAAASVIACDGGLLSLGADAADASALLLAEPQRVTSGVGPEAPDPVEFELESNAAVSGNAPLAFRAEPQNRVATDVAASGSIVASDTDLAGYAASACRAPLLESWLVGGSAATGAADLVVLSNPGDVPATVSLTVYGTDGPVAPPGGSEQVVPARSQIVLPLAGLLLGEESPVVQVTSTGAPVHASLQTSITRTLVAGGVDQVAPIAELALSQTVTGVVVPELSRTAEVGASASLLRVLAPGGDTTATITVTRTGADQPVEPPQEIPLVAGVPVEVDLGALDEGTYSVAVTAEEPLVSAVWQSTGISQDDDFAWFAAAPAVETPSMFAAPSGPTPVLSVVNDSATDDAVVTIVSADGTYRLELTVPAGGSTAARLSARTVYELDPGGSSVRAALSMSGEGALAGFPIWGADAAALPITVYP